MYRSLAFPKNLLSTPNLLITPIINQAHSLNQSILPVLPLINDNYN